MKKTVRCCRSILRLYVKGKKRYIIFTILINYHGRKILEENHISFVIDDFGTGYYNFHCIRDMNPSYVKMDRDFTAKAMNDERDYELYKNIIPMVHSINVRICAEGIEQKEWCQKMKEMQVDYLQGYYYGRPCAREQFIQQYTDSINAK